MPRRQKPTQIQIASLATAFWYTQTSPTSTRRVFHSIPSFLPSTAATCFYNFLNSRPCVLAAESLQEKILDQEGCGRYAHRAGRRKRAPTNNVACDHKGRSSACAGGSTSVLRLQQVRQALHQEEGWVRALWGSAGRHHGLLGRGYAPSNIKPHHQRESLVGKQPHWRLSRCLCAPPFYFADIHIIFSGYADK